MGDVSGAGKRKDLDTRRRLGELGNDRRENRRASIAPISCANLEWVNGYHILSKKVGT
jgi:hypothetical protein